MSPDLEGVGCGTRLESDLVVSLYLSKSLEEARKPLLQSLLACDSPYPSQNLQALDRRASEERNVEVPDDIDLLTALVLHSLQVGCEHRHGQKKTDHPVRALQNEASWVVVQLSAEPLSATSRAAITYSTFFPPLLLCCMSGHCHVTLLRKRCPRNIVESIGRVWQRNI